MVTIPGFYPDNPGSIPRQEIKIWLQAATCCCHPEVIWTCLWFIKACLSWFPGEHILLFLLLFFFFFFLNAKSYNLGTMGFHLCHCLFCVNKQARWQGRMIPFQSSRITLDQSLGISAKSFPVQELRWEGPGWISEGLRPISVRVKLLSRLEVKQLDNPLWPHGL